MTFRHMFVWTVSALVGLVSAVAVIIAFGTTLERFTLANAFLIFISFGSLVFIWLDFILRTNYLKS